MSEAATALRSELLFRRDRPWRYSSFGVLLLCPPRRRSFPDDSERERLERMQEQLYEMLSTYQSARTVGDFRGLLGRNIKNLDHALRRCAWLAPRIDRALMIRAEHHSDFRAKHCPACPWITGQFDSTNCLYPNCALGGIA